ncbi:NADH-quinone oxidoreductase subunit B family protein [Desulfogranum japonicum]|uniref:NADH-quinone oxidoreductase subunit B family protein n=1 Tax=Desulfogranum japonicum TaxID=231447 RepID=UPI000401A651|nr:NADP oxidoreductase [Desulfogranum japonicum]
MTINTLQIATIWLDGCSGCHMSLLDMDEHLEKIAHLFDMVYSPLVDSTSLPASVDLILIEGAVSSEKDLEHLMNARKSAACLVALGDCAVTGNVPSMRNSFSLSDVLATSYQKDVSANPQIPTGFVPALLEHVTPLHAHVQVDHFLPGCPPPASAIFALLSHLLQGKQPDVSKLSRFGS